MHLAIKGKLEIFLESRRTENFNLAVIGYTELRDHALRGVQVVHFEGPRSYR
jgi:hypothetical protein